MDLRQLAFQHHCDVELLATLIQAGSRTRAVEAASQLLRECQGLRGLTEADPRQVGGFRYARIQAALELARRVLEETLVREDALTSVSITRRYLMARLRHQPHEVFAVLFLDNHHRLIAYEELFFGTIDGACVYPRQVVKRALFHNAAAVILAHNHPSGVAEPSQADRHITQRLQEALAVVDVRTLDHFVIGDQATSFAEQGWL